MNTEPAIDPGGGLVRLRLDIAYDGTEFAGWAAQAGQRTVAGVLDDALRRCFAPGRSCGRPGAPTPACTPRVRSHMSMCLVDALFHACPRSGRVRRPRVPAARAASRPVRTPGCRGTRHRPRRSGFRCPVLRAASALCLSLVDRALRRRPARGTLRHGTICGPLAAVKKFATDSGGSPMLGALTIHATGLLLLLTLKVDLAQDRV